MHSISFVLLDSPGQSLLLEAFMQQGPQLFALTFVAFFLDAESFVTLLS